MKQSIHHQTKGRLTVKRPRFFLPLFITMAAALFFACGDNKDQSQSDKKTASSSSEARLTIVSGSENKGLESLIKAFARKKGATIDIQYMGSVDMTLMLAEQGKQIPFDAVWPANSLWIALGDKSNAVQKIESIMRSPVVLGVKKPVAERLGWIGKELKIEDILEAAKAGKLRFAMTSATQSNSGASAYIGFLYAFSGATDSGDALQMEHLENPNVQDKVRDLLSRVNRSSGSSGWLKETVVEHYERFQAMFNYEAMIIEANQELTAKGKPPLYAVYPADGIMIADSPLGYVDKGDAKKAALFDELQAYLLSRDVQDEIMRQGRRTGLVGLNPEKVDKSVFNPEWGIDVKRIISPVPTPGEPVIRKALSLYQVFLRKPSLTAYVVDVSGSMKGQGLEDLKAAMTTLLDPDMAQRYMLQASEKDIHIILPFSSEPKDGVKAEGNSPEILSKLMAFVQGLQAGGGTDIYAAAARGLELVGGVANMENYFPAVILMTDGQSKGSVETLSAAIQKTPMGADIPIFSITFGDADERQLKEISNLTIGRVFPGENLIKAFRAAKGYN